MGIPVPFLSWRKKKQEAEEPSELWKLQRTREYWKARLDRYKWEQENRPDYTKSPQVDEELERSKDPWAYKLKHMSSAEREEALKRQAEYEKTFEYKFFKRTRELEKRWNDLELSRNEEPAWKEDAKFWKSIPHVPGPDGLPLVRKALNGENEAVGRMMDFLRQHLFGLWGYRQRPYPPNRPIDAQQAFGFKWLEKRYKDFTMRSGGWYYKDRLGRTRGPMELVNMQTAWVAGIIDKNTFIWGDDMDEWVPIGMVYGLEQCINRFDVKLVTLGLALVYKLSRGISLTTPRKGHEPKSLQQLQKEAIDDRERQRAVLRLNGGIWPGEREPSHALFLWAGGTQLTDHLTKISPTMPDKFISYPMRMKLLQICPGLRPKDFINIEKVMDALTYQADWYREPLGTFTTHPEFQEEWFRQNKEEYLYAVEDIERFFNAVDKLPRITFPRRPGEKLIVEPKEPNAQNKKITKD